MSLFLSVIIPAYNEEGSLKKGVLDEVNKYLKTVDYKWEVLIVDDGSTDRTPEIVGEFVKSHPGFKLKKEPHRGKGGSVISGMLAGQGEYLLFADMDQATPISEVEKLIEKLGEGYDIAIGSRHGREGAPLLRKVMAYGFSLLRLIVLRLPFNDTQCGFKIFKKSAAKKIFSKMKIFDEKKRIQGSSVSAGFDLELLYLARKLDYKVAEVSVTWHHKEGTKVNPIRDSWEGFRDLMMVRINALQGKYVI
jgi:glycosyltransferase involved in cell wall biosynthesis